MLLRRARVGSYSFGFNGGTHLSSSASLSVTLVGTQCSPQYGERVFDNLDGDRWHEAIARGAANAQAKLVEARRGELAPTWSAAARTAAKSLLCTAGPLFAASELWLHGLWWAAAPLILLAGISFYGVLSILHDLAHDSFLPSKRANAFFGKLLAPAVFLDFDSFKKSHLGHHRFSQSVADPNRFGAEESEEARHPDYRTAEHVPFFVVPWLYLGASLSYLPLRVRHVLYLVGSMMFMGLVLLAFGGDFSLPGRNWRSARQWASLAGSIALGALLYASSPALLVVSITALLIGYACIFSVFAGHITPNQIYWLSPRRATLADSCNVSDVHFGWLARWLGNGFADHHQTHHISPSIPCYHLDAAGAAVAADVAPFVAPPLDLLKPAHCALLFDNLFLSFTLTTTQAWNIQGDAAVRKIQRAL
jgi:fatty acid desaturase